MNKKILIGSIIAVAVLIGVSFTSVVGYSNVKSNSIETSPLFTVRTKRAIDEESRDLIYDYVGKGEEIIIPLPKRKDRAVLQQKFIDIINSMDDTTFNRFLNIVINQIQKENEHEDVNINEVITTINQLRDNPDRTILDYMDKNGKYTWRGEFLLTVCWFPGCILYMIKGYVTLVILVLTLFIPTVWVVICEPPTKYYEIVCNK